MSAYMCEDSTIMALALALHWEGITIGPISDAFSLFDALHQKNIQAMNSRYEDRWNEAEEAAYPADLADLMRRASILATVDFLAETEERGAIREYSYQACECPDWETSPECMALEALTAALASRSRFFVEVEKPALQANACEAERARILKDYPFLEVAGTGKRSGAALAAHNIRQELKRAFPSVKFSITSKNYSMGNHVSVCWSDGPTRAAVDEIISRYEYGSFDGMTDCYNYSSGLGRIWPETFGGTKYANADRDFSEAAYAWALRRVIAEEGIQGVTLEGWTLKSFWNSELRNLRPNMGYHNVGELAYQILNITDASAWTKPDFVPAIWSPNADKGGVEIRFTSAPAESVRALLRADGFRWSQASGCWRAKRTPQTEDLARQLCAFACFAA
jgi:hypothetical protein